MKKEKKEKYIYGSKKIELINTVYMADILRKMSNYNSIMANNKNDYLWFVCLNGEYKMLSIMLITPTYDFETVKTRIHFVFKSYKDKKASYAILSDCNAYGSLDIKDESLKSVNEILIRAEKRNINITDCLVISKDDWYSFYKAGEIEKLKTYAKEEVIKEKIKNKKIAGEVLFNYKRKKTREDL